MLLQCQVIPTTFDLWASHHWLWRYKYAMLGFYFLKLPYQSIFDFTSTTWRETLWLGNSLHWYYGPCARRKSDIGQDKGILIISDWSWSYKADDYSWSTSLFIAYIRNDFFAFVTINFLWRIVLRNTAWMQCEKLSNWRSIDNVTSIE